VKLSTFFRALNTAKEQEKKAKQKARLVGERLNYPILQDMVNAANYYGVVVQVGPLKSGETITISPKPSPKLQTRVRDRIERESDWLEAIESNLADLPGQGR